MKQTVRLEEMVLLQSCCLCVNIKTGTFIIGSLGIILGGSLLAPMSVFLEYHSYYVTQFVATGRDSGKFVDDDQVDSIRETYQL